MSEYLTTIGYHSGMTQKGDRAPNLTDPETIEAIRDYYLAGEALNTIATKCHVSRPTVIRHTADLPERVKRNPLTNAEITRLLKLW